MRGLLGRSTRSRAAALFMLVAGASAPVRAGGPIDLLTPVTFRFSGALEADSLEAMSLGTKPRSKPGRGAREAGSLELAEPVLMRSKAAGVDALLERVAPGRIHSGDMARKAIGLPDEPQMLAGPTPVPTPLARPAENSTPLATSFPPPLPSTMRLTTRLAQNVRTLGEFKSPDWNALRAVTPLAGPESGTGSGTRMVLPSVDVLKLSAPIELPRGSQALASGQLATGTLGTGALGAQLPGDAKRAPSSDGSDTGPAAMAEAEQALADAQARGARRTRARARSGEPLMVLPDFGTSSFQVGASFSLAGSSGGRIAFGEKAPGPFEQGLSSRQGFGLSGTGAGDSLRLGGPDEPAPAHKPAKDDADKRLWTGVVFNF